MTQNSILITGCSTGIGYDAAHGLRNAGWRVFATCRQQKDVDRLSAEGFESFLLDHQDDASMEAAVATVLSATGGTLDALFNNGAYGLVGPLEDVPTDGLRDLFESNFFGYHTLTRLVLPAMRAQGHGRILNCSSVLGFMAMRWRGPYVASKFALEGLSDVLRLEMSDANIDVVLIEPGPIRTEFRKNAIAKFEQWIDWKASPRRAQYESELLDQLYKRKSKPEPFELGPEAVTQAVLKALTARRPKARYRITTPTHIMAWAKRLLPQRVQDWAIRKV
ncbi:SDR family NAD(P)-dependent oxidoreductase [Vannielia litorea]|uniref:SDR family NAD(P)-dependent oxidoreductase n=1 Tax=Vannielia litorea TaxID=1217970 RepID=UPI001C94CEA4|nr:SDR family NAD(P)-dependent oxidoreductase [Vannielia litorea]MBY6050097.1 SDR family NAD(P)-dependent oxidoreductase [Vannielia litorea]MBY6077511.1 SDR family NAD(P)-dependent oxidoreductase [Vannielia litorea]